MRNPFSKPMSSNLGLIQMKALISKQDSSDVLPDSHGTCKFEVWGNDKQGSLSIKAKLFNIKLHYQLDNITCFKCLYG